MGSTISLLNDTEYTWLCRVGPDQKALKISGILAGAVVAMGITVATAGLTLPAAGVAATSIGYPAAGAVGAGFIATGITSLGSVEVAKRINEHLQNDKGFHEILSGATYETGKLSLSLWQQATCIRQETLSPTVLKTKTLYMRPIFSGATDKSTKTYSIKEYVDGKGKVEESIIKLESGHNNSATSNEPVKIN
jgi:hypothetical protein